MVHTLSLATVSCSTLQTLLVLILLGEGEALVCPQKIIGCRISSSCDGRYQHDVFRGNRESKFASIPYTAARRPANPSMPSLSLAPVSAIQSILHNDRSFCLTAVLMLSTFGIFLERRTLVGKALSAPLATMAAGLIVANIGIIPFSSPIYAAINTYLVPLAVPMLLFDSDLRRVFRDTGPLLAAFGVGAMATMVGTLLAYPLLPMRSLGSDGWKVACALAARHIGGAINFVAVAETLSISSTVVSATIAADNVVVALYFSFLFAISKHGENDYADKSRMEASTNSEPSKSATNDWAEQSPQDGENAVSDSSTFSLPIMALALCISSVLVTCGGILTKMLLPPGTSALPLTSVLTVFSATVFAPFFSKIRDAGNPLGIFLIQMFFAASGAAGSIRLVMQQAPSLFAFSSLQIAIHFGFIMSVGRRLLRMDSRNLFLASNANVGGPTTAAAMAQAKDWKRLVLPALLVGILGYSTATALSLALGPILLKLPTVAP